MDFDQNKLDNSIYGTLESRLNILSQLHYQANDPTCYWCGQYDNYLQHVKFDMNNNDYVTNTCTAASVKLQYQYSLLPTDSNLEIQFIAGKALHERKMSLTITNFGNVLFQSKFNTNNICEIRYDVQGTAGTSITLNGECWNNINDIIKIPNNWIISEECNINILKHFQLSNIENNDFLYNSCKLIPDTKIRMNQVNANAYTQIFDALFNNDKSIFVSTEELLLQWKLWDQVLSDNNIFKNFEIQHYPTGSNPWKHH